MKRRTPIFMSTGERAPSDRELTAEELVARLEGDPEWVARRDQQERERQRARQVNHYAAAPIVEELREAVYRSRPGGAQRAKWGFR